MVTPYQIRAETVLESFGTIGDWTVTSGAAVADTTNFLTGATQSIQLSSDSGANGVMTKTISADLSQSAVISLYVYITTATNLSDFVFYLSNDSGFANYYSININPNGNLWGMAPGWNKLLIPRGNFSATGSPSWGTTFTRLRLRIDSGSGVLSGSFGQIGYGGYSRPKIIMGFDDGLASQYTEAYTYMRKYLMTGSCYIIGGKISALPTYMTQAQMQEMYDAGWDIGNHTWTHPTLTSLTSAQQKGEFQSTHNKLVSLGWTRNDGHRHGAYPGGAYDATVQASLAAIDPPMLTYRSLSERSEINGIDQGGQYALKLHNLVQTTTLASMTGWVDDAVNAGDTVEFLIHDMVASKSTSIQINIADFESLIDYIQARRAAGLLDVVTKSEWYKGVVTGETRKLA